MLTEETTASLRSNMRGELIEPSDARYNEARKVYNGMIDRRPRIIARCVDVADVIAAVNFGREHKLLDCDSRWRTQRWRFGCVR